MKTDESELALYRAERRVREIQTKLHRWARDDPHRRFDDLDTPGRKVGAVAEVRSCFQVIRRCLRRRLDMRAQVGDGIVGYDHLLEVVLPHVEAVHLAVAVRGFFAHGARAKL